MDEGKKIIGKLLLQSTTAQLFVGFGWSISMLGQLRYALVRKQQLELDMDWFQIGKGVCQGCILSPCLFNLYAEYIMRNAGLEEAQAGIKIAGRNINNLRYAMTPTLRQKVKRN